MGLLLFIIYVAFVSLGLPDAILGAAWPVMYGEFSVPVGYAGVVSMIISAGTVISSLNTAKLVKRWRTGGVTAISVALTAVSLIGFSFSRHFWTLCLWAIPYGLGAGSVDAALNNFVALHYKSRHMSWLHCFWGIGAAMGPGIVSLCLTNNLTWNSAYQAVGAIQVILTAVLVVSLPLWRAANNGGGDEKTSIQALSLGEVFRIPGARKILLAFFCYCALETTTGLWASSYMVLNRGLEPDLAASWASLFYLGITGGRLVSGFVSERLGDERMVRLGQLVLTAGVLLLFIPASATALAGFLLIGLGCAPIYPSLLHATPRYFGAERSQALIGVQMASAYTGTTLMPPLFGLIASSINIGLLPLFVLFFAILMAAMTESFYAKDLPASSQA